MTEENTKITLTTEDWDLLLPGVEYTIGKTKIQIKPLGLEPLAKVLDALHKLLEDWKEVLVVDEKSKSKKPAITMKDQILLYIPKVSNLIKVHGIDIISDMSGIAESDVKRMPPTVAVSLFDKCLEINIKSQEGLEKNLEGLANQVVTLLENKKQTRPESK